MIVKMMIEWFQTTTDDPVDCVWTRGDPSVDFLDRVDDGGGDDLDDGGCGVLLEKSVLDALDSIDDLDLDDGGEELFLSRLEKEVDENDNAESALASSRKSFSCFWDPRDRDLDLDCDNDLLVPNHDS